MDYSETELTNAIGETTSEQYLQPPPPSYREPLHRKNADSSSGQLSFPQVQSYTTIIHRSEGDLTIPPLASPPSSSSLSSLSLNSDLNLKINLKTSEQEVGQFDKFANFRRFADSLAGKGHDIRTLRDAWADHLHTLGYHVQRRLPVFIPPLQKHDRLSLYVAGPVRLAFEFDMKRPRSESILKLQHFDGARVLIVGQTKQAPYVPGIDLVLACHCRPLPRDAAELANPAFLAFVKEYPHEYYREGIDPDHVYWKCEKHCVEHGTPFTKRVLIWWLAHEYPKSTSVAKPKCSVCRVRPPYKNLDRCAECKWKPR